MAETSIATEYISARIQPDLYSKISKLAETERRALSAMTRILLEEAIDARTKKNPRRQNATV
jgi:hypothetical protein